MYTEIQIIDYLAKWLHFIVGITWIGLLYYFNFVQTEYFKEADPDARVDAFTKLAPRALWWFRWGAMFTLLTGLVMLGIDGAGLTMDIFIGSVMAILMFLNVWLIIWPNQKIVIASNEQIKAGGEALPEAAGAAPKAALASRTNVLFSVPMLYFMGSSAHLPSGNFIGGNMTALIILLIIIAALELNAIFGKQGPLTTVKGVITSGFVLWAVMLGVLVVTG
ncbi:MAG: urate hydroxylase PuuD [Gammaproteobacteria bacterium]|nr:urate hydroxylase PuuD [Gammaproteobacteria bacterium]